MVSRSSFPQSSERCILEETASLVLLGMGRSVVEAISTTTQRTWIVRLNTYIYYSTERRFLQEKSQKTQQCEEMTLLEA